MIIQSYNPANNELLGEVEKTKINEIREAVVKSRQAFKTWGYMTLNERIEHIKKTYESFKNKKYELAELITNEMGMPITESLNDINSGLEYIKWHINNAQNIIGERTTYEDEKEIDKIIFEPKGVVAVIIAWNFPFSSFVWQAIPNLIAGNTVILKHSELVPLSSKFINKIMNSALPENAYNTIYGEREEGRNLAKQNIDMICFTLQGVLKQDKIYTK